jgi:hypothetical protein
MRFGRLRLDVLVRDHCETDIDTFIRVPISDDRPFNTSLSGWFNGSSSIRRRALPS